MRTCFVGEGDDAIDCWVLRALFPLNEVLLPPCTLYIRGYLYSESSTLINDCFVGGVSRSTVLLTMLLLLLLLLTMLLLLLLLLTILLLLLLLGVENERADVLWDGTGRDGRTRLARKNNFQARTVTDQKKILVQLITRRIGRLTRLIHTLLHVVIIQTYIHTYIHKATGRIIGWQRCSRCDW